MRTRPRRFMRHITTGLAALLVLGPALHAATDDYIPWPNAGGRGSSAGQYQRPASTSADAEAIQRLQQRLMRQNPGFVSPQPRITVTPAPPPSPPPRRSSTDATRRLQEQTNNVRSLLREERARAVADANRLRQQIVATRDDNGTIRLQSVTRNAPPTAPQQARVDEATRQLVGQENLMVRRGLLRDDQRTVATRVISQKMLDMLSSTADVRATQQRLLAQTQAQNQPLASIPASRTPQAIANAARREAAARAADEARTRALNNVPSRNTWNSGPIVDAANKIIDANAQLARRVLRAPILTGHEVRRSLEDVQNNVRNKVNEIAHSPRNGTTLANSIRQDVLSVSNRVGNAVRPAVNAINTAIEKFAKPVREKIFGPDSKR